MPWNGSGVYSRTDGTRTGASTWAQADSAGVAILSADHDVHDEDIATAINACLNKNGENAATADISMGSNQLLLLGDAALLTDGINAGQVQKNAVCYGGTAGGTANALTLTCAPAMTGYTTGQVVYFKAASVNTAGVTVNINGVGVVNLLGINGGALPYGTLQANGFYGIIYNGTAWLLFTRGSMPFAANGWSPTFSGDNTLSLSGWTADHAFWRRDPDTNLVTFAIHATGTVASGTGTEYRFTLPVNANTTNGEFSASFFVDSQRFIGQGFIQAAGVGAVTNTDHTNLVTTGTVGISAQGFYQAA